MYFCNMYYIYIIINGLFSLDITYIMYYFTNE